jgi:hypothetical protein
MIIEFKSSRSMILLSSTGELTIREMRMAMGLRSSSMFLSMSRGELMIHETRRRCSSYAG